MKKLFIMLFLILTPVLYANPLIGRWVSRDEPILKMIEFQIIFNEDMTYEINCSLGVTKGTYIYNDKTIYFTPTEISVKDDSGRGKKNVYDYKFINENTFMLKAEVHIILVKVK